MWKLTDSLSALVPILVLTKLSHLCQRQCSEYRSQDIHFFKTLRCLLVIDINSRATNVTFQRGATSNERHRLCHRTSLLPLFLHSLQPCPWAPILPTLWMSAESLPWLCWTILHSVQFCGAINSLLDLTCLLGHNLTAFMWCGLQTPQWTGCVCTHFTHFHGALRTVVCWLLALGYEFPQSCFWEHALYLTPRNHSNFCWWVHELIPK